MQTWILSYSLYILNKRKKNIFNFKNINTKLVGSDDPITFDIKNVRIKILK